MGHRAQAFKCWVDAQTIFKEIIFAGNLALKGDKQALSKFTVLTSSSPPSKAYLKQTEEHLDIVSTNIASMKIRHYLEMAMHELKTGRDYAMYRVNGERNLDDGRKRLDESNLVEVESEIKRLEKRLGILKSARDFIKSQGDRAGKI